MMKYKTPQLYCLHPSSLYSVPKAGFLSVPLTHHAYSHFETFALAVRSFSERIFLRSDRHGRFFSFKSQIKFYFPEEYFLKYIKLE